MIKYIGMNNEHMVYVSENREEIEKLPNITITEIRETEDQVEFIDGNYYIGENPIREAKQVSIRNVRNDYLEKYVDPVVSNPLRWADLTEIEQQRYVYYRLYLLNYTKEENWWEKEPKTFEEWVG